ncbi:hypothetical protein [Paraburkholderia sp. SIMBA_054]|uniref:hypothetical protein n=1 Tax=Paraburkholderia sp. SIMBA_054 TaxID=3085795 RepID=UPI00397D96B1
MKTHQSPPVGLEAWIAATAILLLFLHLIPLLASFYAFSLLVGLLAVASGAGSTFISFKDGSGWLGALLPLGLLGWGLSALLHLPPH